MSAISGIYQRDGSFVNQSKLALMIEASAPRGLDGTNYLVKDSVGLAHQMLHTTPESLTEKQPLSDQSAGCIFKNPRGLSAGSLIDQAGLKGTHVGGAAVSDRHANFIVTSEGCKSDDVLRLVDLIRSKVSEQFGVDLELEIQIW